MKMTWPRRAEGDYPECPTDYFFAELSGNWDLDANGYAGEYPADYATGGIDQYPEIVVGRIPYYGYMTDLDKILAKTVTFEKATDIAWRKNALLPMEPSDGSTPGYQLGEEIRTNFLIPRGFASTRIYEEDYGVAPEITPCDISNVRSAWSTGAYGVTTWWTHGSETYAADVFSSSDASYLDDAHPSFTFQNSCTNGSPEYSNNLGYALLRNGAIGTVSASRVSWYWRGQSSFVGSPQSNAMMAYAYTGALTYDSLVAGRALNKVRRAMIVDGSWWAMNLADFNLYGDPSVGLFTSAPSRPVPTGLSAVAGIRQVSLSWDAFVGAIKYYVLRSVAGGKLVVVDSMTTNSFKDVGLTDNTAYTYAVSARTSVEVTGNSSTVRSLTAPAAVANLSGLAGNHRATLAWSASEGATSYRIYRLESEGDPTLVKTVNGTRDTLLGLVNGQEYGFVVVSVNENGTVGSPSDPVTVVPVFTLDRVEGLTAVGGDAIADLSWKAVDGAESYVVYRGSESEESVAIDTVTALVFHDQGLYNGMDYVYSVAALKSGKLGPASVAVWMTPRLPVPAIPTGIAAAGKVSAVDVSWKASARATGYDVYRSQGVTEYVKVGATTALSFQDVSLTPYVRYFYKIAATNATGASALSDSAGATVLAPIPAAPASVVATAGDRSIVVNWAAVQYASTYTVKTATVAGGPYTVAKSGISETSANLTGLVNGTTYYMVVSATNGSGEGPNSAEASATPVVPPSGLKVMYKVGDASATDNTIRPLIQLANTSNAAIALNDVTIRYWFTNEQAKGQTYWCDWAQIGCSNLTGTYKALAKSVPGCRRVHGNRLQDRRGKPRRRCQFRRHPVPHHAFRLVEPQRDRRLVVRRDQARVRRLEPDHRVQGRSPCLGQGARRGDSSRGSDKTCCDGGRPQGESGLGGGRERRVLQRVSPRRQRRAIARRSRDVYVVPGQCGRRRHGLRLLGERRERRAGKCAVGFRRGDAEGRSSVEGDWTCRGRGRRGGGSVVEGFGRCDELPRPARRGRRNIVLADNRGDVVVQGRVRGQRHGLRVQGRGVQRLGRRSCVGLGAGQPQGSSDPGCPDRSRCAVRSAQGDLVMGGGRERRFLQHVPQDDRRHPRSAGQVDRDVLRGRIGRRRHGLRLLGERRERRVGKCSVGFRRCPTTTIGRPRQRIFAFPRILA